MGLATAAAGKIVGVQFSGFRELDKTLQDLSKKEGVKIARAGLSQALTVVARQIRKNVPVGETKQLKKSIGKRLKRIKKKDIFDAITGINVGKKRGKQVPHSHLAIAGTAQRQTQSGANRGQIQPNDAVSRAMAQSRSEAFQKMLKVARERVAKYKGKR